MKKKICLDCLSKLPLDKIVGSPILKNISVFFFPQNSTE